MSPSAARPPPAAAAWQVCPYSGDMTPTTHSTGNSPHSYTMTTSNLLMMVRLVIKLTYKETVQDSREDSSI